MPGPARFSVGDRVKIVGDDRPATVVSPGQSYGSTYFYGVLQVGERESALYPEEDLELIKSGRDSPVDWLVDQPLVDAQAFGEFLTLQKLRTRLSDVLYSFLSSRTIFRVYQFKPVLKLMASPYQRLLIADEVGLGKTIEAGLVWNELDARMSIDRVLIVCPAALRRKWQLELERRFDREVPVILVPTQLAELVDRYAKHGERTKFAAIVGLEMLRQEKNLARLRDASLTVDLSVVDEAHHLRNTATLSYSLGEFLSDASDYLLFLTATPLNLGEPDLFNLIHLLLPEEFDDFEVFRSLLEPNEWINKALRELRRNFPPDAASVLQLLEQAAAGVHSARFRKNPYYVDSVTRLKRPEPLTRREVVEAQRRLTDLNTLAYVYNRTRKRDLAERLAVRRAVSVEVEWSPQEWALYQAVKDYVRTRMRALAGARSTIGFASIMPERQASSCLPAARDYFLESLGIHRVEARFDEGEEEFPEDTLDLEAEDEAALRNLAGAIAALGGKDSKFAALQGWLEDLFQRKPSSQVLIFSFFKRTLAYLEEKISSCGHKVRRIDGTTPRPVREETLEEFRRGEFQVLLSSEVGAEGLDFEFCQYLFNYDLPWNPMRLEQRIGRLDRFGQRHSVIFIGNLHVPGTIDTEIFERLYQRIGIFERSIGELEPILGAAMRELQQALLSPDLDTAEQQREADRIVHALESKAVALEEFERDRERLVGQDEYVVEQLQDIERNRRYMTGEELETLFKGFLDRTVGAQGYRLSVDPGDERIYYFTARPEFGRVIREHTSDRDASVMDLLAAIEAGSGIAITFDAEAAYQRSAEFLTPRHPFMTAIIDYYEKTQVLRRAGQFEIDGPVSGDFLFFIYLFEASGLVPRHVLLTVAVNLDAASVHDGVSELILPALARREARPVPGHPVWDMQSVEEAHQVALEWAMTQRADWLEELTRNNQAIILARQESLRQSLSIRGERIAEAVRNTSDSRIKRMKEAQGRNLRSRVEAKLEHLDRQRKVTVSVKPLAGGYVKVVSTPSSESSFRNPQQGA